MYELILSDKIEEYDRAEGRERERRDHGFGCRADTCMFIGTTCDDVFFSLFLFFLTAKSKGMYILPLIH